MSKSNENKLVPRLRFPDFMNKGEWEEKALKNISEVIMGSSPSSSSYNENKNGLPLLQGNADIKNRKSAPRIYTSEVTKECQIGDILLSVRAPVGTVAKSLHKACIGRGIAAIRAIHNNSQEFLYQWLFSYESSWKNVSQGGTFDAVNSDDVRNLKLPIPASQEQQQIASCLSSLDEVITAESQKLEVLKEHKKGLLQNLFPQEGERVPKLRFKEFKGEWEEKKLEEVATFVNEKTPLENLSISSYISTENILPDFAGVTSASKLPTSGNFTKYRKGDVLISNIRPYLKKVWFSDKEGAGSNDVFVVRTKSDIQDFFLSFLLKNDNFINYVMVGAKGVKMPRGDKDLISKYPISFPSKTEQQKIASGLSSLDEIIQAQAEKIELLQLHKKGLLQGLFPKMND